jgi:amidophosphoribosyltransferase
MCGIVGIVGPTPVAKEILFGLTALQHRGQDAAGVVTFDRRFHTIKGKGLVSQVFPNDASVEGLTGNMGLGHVRYATQGSTDVADAQPFSIGYPFGLAMIHNGNVTNFDELRERLYRDHHRLIETSNDVELLLYALSSAVQRHDLGNLAVADLFRSVEEVQLVAEGAYSALALVAGKGMLAFRDIYGIRPMLLGQKLTPQGKSVIVTSETTVLDVLGYDLVRDLKPGEAVFVATDGTVTAHGGKEGVGAFCAFEFVYFAREDSTLNGQLVAQARYMLGQKLAPQVRALGIQPDIVIDVPSSAYFAATGLAEALGVPYRRGFSKNNHVGRSFIVPTQLERERVVRQKLNPMREVVEGKKVAIVDDSIVRGTTSKHIVKLLRDVGATAVYFISAAPPIKHPCVYGIDMATREEIIAANHTTEEIREFIGADAVVYQRLEDLKEMYAKFAGCFACFSGEYPTQLHEGILARIQDERRAKRGSTV